MLLLPRLSTANSRFSAGLASMLAAVLLLSASAANAFSQSSSSHAGISRGGGLVTADAAAAAAPCVMVGRRRRTHSRSNSRRSMYIGDGRTDGSTDDEADNAMSSNRLSHVMLRVPDVDATVNYWVDKGATIKQRSKSPKTGGGETAFVALGNGKAEHLDSSFSLEITSLPPEEEVVPGNGLAYLGTSMLLDFQNNLMGAAAGEKIATGKEEVAEPNGIEVRRVASGPGDYFARLCLRPKPLAKDAGAAAVNGEGTGTGGSSATDLSPLEITQQFYTDILGMRVVANDIGMLCLRYQDGGFGVSTTLVFSTEDQSSSSREDDELVMGNMLDHLVIGTPSVQDAVDALKETEQGREAIFMEPTSIFGTTILGVMDPNGYKIYLAEV